MLQALRGTLTACEAVDCVRNGVWHEVAFRRTDKVDGQLHKRGVCASRGLPDTHFRFCRAGQNWRTLFYSKCANNHIDSVISVTVFGILCNDQTPERTDELREAVPATTPSLLTTNRSRFCLHSLNSWGRYLLAFFVPLVHQLLLLPRSFHILGTPLTSGFRFFPGCENNPLDLKTSLAPHDMRAWITFTQPRLVYVLHWNLKKARKCWLKYSLKEANSG